MTPQRVGELRPVCLRGIPRIARVFIARARESWYDSVRGRGSRLRETRRPSITSMHARHDTFLGVFRAADPLGSDDFRLLCDQVAATPDAKLLQEFLAALNRDLARRVEHAAMDDVEWAVKLCVGLADASPDAMVTALGALVNDGTLWFHDPVIAVAFEAA